MKVTLGFSWWVDAAGYRFADVAAADGGHGRRCLVDNSTTRRLYKPLEAFPGLFFAFAEVDYNDEHAVETFAGRYGRLGRGAEVAVRGADAAVGEPLDAWKDNVLAMRTLVSLWDAYRRQDAVELGAHIHWWRNREGEAFVHYTNFPFADLDQALTEPLAEDPVPPPEVGRGRPPAFNAGDVLAPALAYLQLKVNERLAGLTSTRLLLRPGGGRLELGATPVSLLGALWLQFAAAIAGGGGEAVACAECGRRFVVAAGASRSSRRFCSHACRIRAYRGRKARARELCAEGKSLREVARAVGSDVKTVKGWVEGQKG